MIMKDGTRDKHGRIQKGSRWEIRQHITFGVHAIGNDRMKERCLNLCHCPQLSFILSIPKLVVMHTKGYMLPVLAQMLTIRVCPCRRELCMLDAFDGRLWGWVGKCLCVDGIVEMIPSRLKRDCHYIICITCPSPT